jgi:hypothetical protein
MKGQMTGWKAVDSLSSLREYIGVSNVWAFNASRPMVRAFKFIFRTDSQFFVDVFG